MHFSASFHFQVCDREYNKNNKNNNVQCITFSMRIKKSSSPTRVQNIFQHLANNNALGRDRDRDRRDKRPERENLFSTIFFLFFFRQLLWGVDWSVLEKEG